MADAPELVLRHAVEADIAAIETLIAASVRGLQQEYSAAQREGALGTVFGVDRRLIEDRTYFVITAGEEIAACGGWSRRQTLFGSDHAPGKNDALLDPAQDAARIRAFFVHPNWARRGLGTRILKVCEAAAMAEGFTRLELGATLTGIPLYEAHGFAAIEEQRVPLANGVSLPIVRMGKNISERRQP